MSLQQHQPQHRSILIQIQILTLLLVVAVASTSFFVVALSRYSSRYLSRYSSRYRYLSSFCIHNTCTQSHRYEDVYSYRRRISTTIGTSSLSIQSPLQVPLTVVRASVRTHHSTGTGSNFIVAVAADASTTPSYTTTGTGTGTTSARASATTGSSARGTTSASRSLKMTTNADTTDTAETIIVMDDDAMQCTTDSTGIAVVGKDTGTSQTQTQTEEWDPNNMDHVEKAKKELLIWPLDEYNTKLLNEVHPFNLHSITNTNSTTTPLEMYDLIAIGSGAGGLVSSKQSARRNAKSAMISAHLAGGDCLNVGVRTSRY